MNFIEELNEYVLAFGEMTQKANISFAELGQQLSSQTASLMEANKKSSLLRPARGEITENPNQIQVLDFSEQKPIIVGPTEENNFYCPPTYEKNEMLDFATWLEEQNNKIQKILNEGRTTL